MVSKAIEDYYVTIKTCDSEPYFFGMISSKKSRKLLPTIKFYLDLVTEYLEHLLSFLRLL